MYYIEYMANMLASKSSADKGICDKTRWWYSYDNGMHLHSIPGTGVRRSSTIMPELFQVIGSAFANSEIMVKHILSGTLDELGGGGERPS